MMILLSHAVQIHVCMVVDVYQMEIKESANAKDTIRGSKCCFTFELFCELIWIFFFFFVQDFAL
mgnify:CR=1 FL=1